MSSRDIATGAPIIELRYVTKTFRNGDVAVEVLHGISLKIFPGEFVAIMGASGSGKSTLMYLLGCLDRPTGGAYFFAGQDVSGFDRDERALLRRDAFGFIFQQYNLLATSTATENVEVPAVYAGLGHGERVTRAQAILGSLGLGERLDHRPSQLSGGQQQRVSIARALMNGGQVILADEPTGALDTKSGHDVMGLLHQLHEQGHTIILITHDAKVAAEAERLIQITDGLITADSGAKIRPGDPLKTGALPDGKTAHRNIGVALDMAEAWKMAFRSLRANLFRTVLTLLGIVIGVGSVVAMLAIGDGAKQQILDRIQAMGTNLLLIRPGAPGIRNNGPVATLTTEDAQAIAALPNVAAAVPEFTFGITLRAGSIDYQTNVDATTPEFMAARNWPVARGDFINADDLQTYTSVVVLGQTVAKTLYPDGADPVGKYVLINNVPFQVIGVMTAKGATPYGADQDDVAFVPLSTGRHRLFGQNYVKSVTVQVDDVAAIDDTQQTVTDLLKARHRTTDFQIRNMASILDAATQTQDTLTILLGSIAAISLLVGGIGVMNIMLVSVTERTREIGIRMATGARTKNIMLQFITEAVVVCAIGGILGVIGGFATGWIVSRLGTPVLFSWMPVALAFGCAFLTGLVFGYMPARKAASLDPVVALAAD
jgi:macrolide transport system ATP-binding/permease protein